jgi:hypothetical protein
MLAGQALELTIPVVDQDTGATVQVEGATVDVGLGSSSTAAPAENLPHTEDGHEITITVSSEKSQALAGSSHYVSVWVTILGDSTPVARIWLEIRNSTRT